MSYLRNKIIHNILQFQIFLKKNVETRQARLYISYHSDARSTSQRD